MPHRWFAHIRVSSRVLHILKINTNYFKNYWSCRSPWLFRRMMKSPPPPDYLFDPKAYINKNKLICGIFKYKKKQAKCQWCRSDIVSLCIKPRLLEITRSSSTKSINQLIYLGIVRIIVFFVLGQHNKRGVTLRPQQANPDPNRPKKEKNNYYN